MSVFYGSDTACLTDLTLIDRQVTDPKTLIAQRLARRLQTPRGALANIGDDPNFGWDVRQYLNGKFTTSTTITAQEQIQSECLKDEQVATAKAAVTLVNGTMTIALSIVSSAGPFTLTMNVNQLTTALVFNF